MKTRCKIADALNRLLLSYSVNENAGVEFETEELVLP
jgi:hypothetical protein